MKVEKQVLGSPMGLHLENLYKKKNFKIKILLI